MMIHPDIYLLNLKNIHNSLVFCSYWKTLKHSYRSAWNISATENALYTNFLMAKCAYAFFYPPLLNSPLNLPFVIKKFGFFSDNLRSCFEISETAHVSCPAGFIL